MTWGQQAGLDGLCFIRWVEFGAKCSIIGLINAVVLIPVYYTEDDSPSNLNARDKLSRISLGRPPLTPHLPSTPLQSTPFDQPYIIYFAHTSPTNSPDNALPSPDSNR